MSKSLIYNFEVKNIDGNLISLTKYEGQTLLIVNTASQCHFTQQYEELESLYQKYKNKNFVILGFPCNQFGGQEPDDEKKIKEFCRLRQVTFPLFAKIEVNGPHAHPFFKYLKKQKKGFLGTEFIKWNFTKFLVNKEGKVVERFAPQVKIEQIGKKIEVILN